MKIRFLHIFFSGFQNKDIILNPELRKEIVNEIINKSSPLSPMPGDLPILSFWEDSGTGYYSSRKGS
ncbi:MAG: hypothetical protein ABSD71_03640 [Bacteroidales bacterium]|jgi:hypothetical protein